MPDASHGTSPPEEKTPPSGRDLHLNTGIKLAQYKQLIMNGNEIKPLIQWTDFEKIDMRSGTIIDAVLFEKARKPAYQLQIDFGPLGIKKSSAQLTALYSPDDLIGKQVIAVVNFPIKQIANFFSECLVLGLINDAGSVVLLTADQKTDNGQKVA